MSEAPIIDIQNLSCKSGKQYLLHDINWQVRPGENWVVFGLNGSGKTTLLGAIAGFLPYTHGSLQVFGESYNDENLFRLRQRIGFVSSSFFDKVVAKEAVISIVLSGLFGSLGIRGFVRDDQRVHAEDLLAAFRLREKMEYPFKMLSKGERQNVLIARALLTRPDILILDEPGTGLDVMAREKTLYLVRKLAREAKMTVIYVTHYPEELQPEFEHCMLLRRGRIYRKGATRDLFCEKVLAGFLEEDVSLEMNHRGCYELHSSQPMELCNVLKNKEVW